MFCLNDQWHAFKENGDSLMKWLGTGMPPVWYQPMINDFTVTFIKPEANPFYNPYLSPFGNHPILLPFMQPVWSWFAHNLPEPLINPMSYPHMTGLMAPNIPSNPWLVWQQQLQAPLKPMLEALQQWQQQFWGVSLQPQAFWQNPWMQGMQEWAHGYELFWQNIFPAPYTF